MTRGVIQSWSGQQLCSCIFVSQSGIPDQAISPVIGRSPLMPLRVTHAPSQDQSRDSTRKGTGFCAKSYQTLEDPEGSPTPPRKTGQHTEKHGILIFLKP